MKQFKVQVREDYNDIFGLIPKTFKTKVLVSNLSFKEWNFGICSWTKKIYIKCIDGKYRNIRMFQAASGKSIDKLLTKLS